MVSRNMSDGVLRGAYEKIISDKEKLNSVLFGLERKNFK